jgi:hypothetical protein
MSKEFVWGAGGAVFVAAVFLGGIFAGVTLSDEYHHFDIRNAEQRNSPQMQCIKWVDGWRGTSPTTLGEHGPNFEMYVSLCGQPETSRQ